MLVLDWNSTFAAVLLVPGWRHPKTGEDYDTREVRYSRLKSLRNHTNISMQLLLAQHVGPATDT